MSFELQSGFVSNASRAGSNMAGRGVRYTGLALPALPGKLKELGQAALVDAAKWFQKERMPAKFSVQAYDRYGGIENDVFEKREGVPDWLVKKYGADPATYQGGQVRPLYRSGYLRSLILRGQLQTKATGSGIGMKVRAWWPGLPRYTYMYNPNFKRTGRGLNNSKPLVHNKVRELTMMDAQDVAGMRAAYEKSLARALNRMGNESSGESPAA